MMRHLKEAYLCYIAARWAQLTYLQRFLPSILGDRTPHPSNFRLDPTSTKPDRREACTDPLSGAHLSGIIVQPALLDSKRPFQRPHIPKAVSSPTTLHKE